MDAVNDLSEEEQKQFYRDIKGLKGKVNLTKFMTERLKLRNIHSQADGKKHEFLPLSVYATQGFDVEAIRTKCKDTMEHEVLGTCYRLDIFAGSDFKKREKVRETDLSLTPAPKAAPPTRTGEPATKKPRLTDEEKEMNKNKAHAERVYKLVEPVHKELKELCAHPAVVADQSPVSAMYTEDVLELQRFIDVAQQAKIDGDITQIPDMTAAKNAVVKAKKTLKLLQQIDERAGMDL